MGNPQVVISGTNTTVDRIAARSARNKDVVRWYLMIYPFGRKGLMQGLEREIARREKANEPPIEYFAPAYVEAHEVGNAIVRTEKQLLFNYVFVRASENELFRMKTFEGQYNFPRRETTCDGEYYYPYVSDKVMQNLKWVARSYSGVLPLYVGDSSWLVKGDRVRIKAGPFKGVEASVYSTKQGNRKEIMVAVDKWMSIPILAVKEGQYEVIALNDSDSTASLDIDDDLIPQLHDILCRQFRRELTEEDIRFAKRVILRYDGREPSTDVMRCKFYSIMLMAHTIIGDADKVASLLAIINILLPVIKAEQSKALLLTTLYGCTDNSRYHHLAHQLVDPWKQEASPKRSKQNLLLRLADYDGLLGH